MISRINFLNKSFSGLLTITGPNKEDDVTLNTDNVSTILKKPYIDKKDDSIVGIGTMQGAIIAMNNGTIIHTFLPAETVINAYQKAKTTDEYKLETKYNPVISKPLL